MSLESKKIACVILSIGKRYEKLSLVSFNSFKIHNPDVNTYLINEKNLSDYSCSKYLGKIGIGILKYMLGYEIMKTKNYNKIIILGSDTITCSRLDEFIDDQDSDIIATLDYPYQFYTNRAMSPDSETHLNADVVCFNNLQAISDIIKVSIYHPIYYEQGGLNEVVWMQNKYKTKIADYPYSSSKVIYNVRAKGNIIANTGEKPWKEYVSQYKVRDNKLFSFDNKQIKVFHYCEGLGTLDEYNFNEILNWWIFSCFNEETKTFFKNVCGVGDFFEKRYEE